MEKICVGIVTFNPEIGRLRENINSIYNQSDLLIIIDNHSSNVDSIKKTINPLERIVLIENSKNCGIAKGLNQMCNYAKQKGYDWILTLDQDSVCPKNLLLEMKKYIHICNVGIICPRFKNNISNNKTNKSNINVNEYDEIDMCITSGSLMRIEAWEKSGKFDDWMFIDCVDYDICMKFKLNNYKVIRINSLILDHHVGEGNIKYFFNRKIVLYNHNKVRNYYFVRNYIYIIRKYKNYIKPMRRLAYIFYWELKKFIFEGKRLDTIKSLFRGIKDGLQCKI